MRSEITLYSEDITLINIEERNLKSNNYSKYIFEIQNKGISKIHVKLLIKLNFSDEIIGYILSYNYDITNGYIFLDYQLNEKYINKYLNTVIHLFCNYLYICFPIRKIYYELCVEKPENYIDFLNKSGFVQEACLKKDTFFNNNYLDKYIFSLSTIQKSLLNQTSKKT